jgi:hypothetical protein
MIGWLRVTAVAVVTAAALPMGAGAAFADTPVPHGALTPLTGAGSCYGLGCASLRGVAPSDSGDRFRLMFSRSATTLYGIDPTPAAIAVLSRNQSTGAVTQFAGRRGCVTTAPTRGCALLRVRGRVTGLRISSDGRLISTSGAHPAQFTRNPSTGAVRPASGRCWTAISFVCGRLRGLTGRTGSFRVDNDTRVIAGYATGDGIGLAVLRRTRSGRWRQLSGKAGCQTTHGNAGCSMIPCPTPASQVPAHRPFQVTTVAASDDGSHVYAGGGSLEEYATLGGFLASFRRTSSGGLVATGCLSGRRQGITAVPTWISALPGSSTMLVAQRSDDTRYDETDYWVRIFAGIAGHDSALAPLRRISSNLGLVGAELTLSGDGQTLYGADIQTPTESIYAGGGLHVYSVKPTAVTALPTPFSLPYQAIQRHGNPQYGIDDVLRSPDDRSVYIATGTTGYGNTGSEPGIRAYSVAP